MTRCDRFEDEGLLQLERGVPLDAHFDTCPDCLDARRVHARLVQEIAALDSEIEPSPAWTDGVWDKINEQRGRRLFWRDATPSVPRHSRKRWLPWIAPAGAIAALALLWVSVGRFGGESPPPFLTAEVYAGQTVVLRGEDAHPGDLLRVRGTIAGYAYAELRVYFNDSEVIARCSAGSSCVQEGGAISTTTPLKSLGAYRPVLIVSSQAIPASVGSLDQDAGAALRAGAFVQAGDPIPVR